MSGYSLQIGVFLGAFVEFFFFFEYFFYLAISKLDYYSLEMDFRKENISI